MKTTVTLYNELDLELDDRDYVFAEFREDFETLMETLHGVGVIASGTVGRWNGRYDTGAVFRTFEDFIFSPLFEDCTFLRVEDQDGHLVFYGIHHDATNVYEVKILTERGQAHLKEAYPDFGFEEPVREPVESVFNNKRYSALPNMAKFCLAAA